MNPKRDIRTIKLDNWLFLAIIVVGLVFNPAATIAAYLIIGLVSLTLVMLRAPISRRLNGVGMTMTVLIAPFVLYHSIIVGIETFIQDKRS